jgi:hypothetical protein
MMSFVEGGGRGFEGDCRGELGNGGVVKRRGRAHSIEVMTSLFRSITRF